MSKLTNIAVLIDADNASVNTIAHVFEKIETLGKIRCKKIYGDWGQTNLSSWQTAILRFAIDPMQQFSYVKGKNATDIALVIEAMDLLHSGEYDGFCLVSSDSDFASLAVRIRKNGLPVYGFGKSSAVVSFKQACDKFFAVEDLVESVTKTTTENTKKIAPIPTNQLKIDTKLMNALRDVVAQTLDKNDGDWSNYGEMVQLYKRKYPALAHENYGYEKLIHLIKATELFEVKDKKEDGNYRLFVKAKKTKDEPPTSVKFTTKQLQAETAFIQAIEELIKTNPKSENGWVNISYIASQLNQNPAIDTKKYGYVKFSELITALKLFDLKKQQNGVFVKLKTPKAPPTTKPTQPANPAIATTQTSETTPVMLGDNVDFFIYSDSQVDNVLWRLADNNKVRHDGDMIFYGQTHSEDSTISLDVNDLYSHFACNLASQPTDIHRIIFTSSSETEAGMHTKPLRVVIEKSGEPLFDGEFLLDNPNAQSVLLFELIRMESSWRFVPRKQAFSADLRKLCDKLGIEVSDD